MKTHDWMKKEVILEARVVLPLLTLACGVLIITGLFLPWLSEKSTFGVGPFAYTGWNVYQLEISLMVLIGSISVIACSLAIIAASHSTRFSKTLMKPLGILSATSAMLALFGSLWFICIYYGRSGLDSSSILHYGVYLTTAAASVAIIFSVSTPTWGFRVLHLVRDTTWKTFLKVMKPTIILILGAITLAAVFLPWVYISENPPISLMRTKFLYDLAGNPFLEFYLILIGSVVLVISSLLLYTASLYIYGGRKVFRFLGAGVTIGALISIIGVSTFWAAQPDFIYESVEGYSYGVYICISAAALELILGVMTMFRGQSLTCADIGQAEEVVEGRSRGKPGKEE